MENGPPDPGQDFPLALDIPNGCETRVDLLDWHFKDDIIEKIINQNKIPVVAPLGLDENNQSYNINGDTAANAIAKKLKSRRLLLMTNVEGVYDDNKKLISEIKPFDLKNLFDPKFFLPKKSCTQKCFNQKKNFCPKIFLTQKFFLPNNIF